MHVGDLDGSSAAAARARWEATVTITIHDSNHNPVVGAAIDGAWSNGITGGGSCATDASGQCSFIKANIKSNVNSGTYTISNVTLTGSTYDGSANHDPDLDSIDGTVITIQKP